MPHVVCLLNVEEDRATFTWSEGPASFEPYQLEGGIFADFKEAVTEAREKLSDLVKDYLFDEQNLPKASLALAEAGHELYLQMFDPGARQARIANEVRTWLQSLTSTRSVDTLEIVVESPWSIPWNVVYDQEPDKDAFLSNREGNRDRWAPFWAIRYDLTGGRRVSPLRRMPALKDPHVLLVIDPQIRDGLPQEQQQELAGFIGSHDVKVVYGKDDLIAESKARRPDLLYWLSHATPSALVLGDEEITPRQLRKLLRRDDSDNPYSFGGIAFLNACQTAESGEAGSFFDALHSVGFSGMVGTEHQTVDTFANRLGLRFLESFLIQGAPLGEIMRELRAHVPLGLLYGTYCPPDLRVVRQVPDNITDSVVIVQTPFESGVALGAEAATVAARSPLPEEPYRSLAFYGYHDRALFAGRDEDVERFATLLDDEKARIVVLHGESGVGKSSFLRAGIIPYLEEECVGYRFVREHLDRPQGQEDSALFVRATNDLAGSLAQSLSQFSARPFRYSTPTGNSVEVDLPGVLASAMGGSADPTDLREAMLNDPGLLGRLLGAIGDSLPFSPVLVIDQCEEIFTLAQTPEDDENRQLALAMLRHVLNAPSNFKIILSLRTEYYGRLIDGLRRGVTEAGGIREYLLTDFDEEALIEAIERPASLETGRYSAEVPFEKYGFQYAEGVPEEIARRISRYSLQRRDSVLPLMQVICNQIYQRVRNRDDKTVRLDDLQALGGIEGGMRKHVEHLVEELFPAHPGDKRRLQQLFTQLYLRQPDGSLTTALLPEDDVARRWTGRMAFEQLVEQSRKLRLLNVNTLRIGGQVERRYVSLGHDALAKLAAAWDEELSRGARLRKMGIAIASVSGVAVVMLVLAAVAEGQRGVAEEQRAVARKQRDAAREARNDALDAVDRYFTEVSQDRLLNEPGQQKLRKELMGYAREYFEKFSEEEKEKNMDSAGDPDLQARLARTYYNLGRLHIEVDEKHKEAIKELNKGKQIQNRLVTESRENGRYRKELSDTWTEIGNAAIELKDSELVKAAYEEAYQLRKQLYEEQDEQTVDVELQLKLASAMMNLGLYEMSRIEEAESMVEEAENGLARPSLPWFLPAQKNVETAKACLTEARSENEDEAIRHMEEAQEIRARQLTNVDSDDDKADVLQVLADGSYNLGLLHQAIYRTNKLLDPDNPEVEDSHAQLSRDHLKDAIDRLESVLEIRPGDMTAQLYEGYCYRSLGDIAESLDERFADYTKAEEKLERLARENPLVDELQKEYADSCWLLGDVYGERADSPQDDKQRETDIQSAISAYESARRQYAKLLQKKSPLVKPEDKDLEILDDSVETLKKRLDGLNQP